MSALPPAMLERFTALRCGYPKASSTSVSVVGLELKVFGLEEIKESKKPLVVLIAAHGRMCDETTMYDFASGILGHVGDLSMAGNQAKDLVVVTLDQRNHGLRTKNVTSNLGYEENPTHYIDMSAMVKGGAQDFSLIIDFLAAYLFPNGEKVIDEFMATGISLGGHVTWLCLRDDPRIRVGIPIIGLPFESFPHYMGPRALKSGIPFAPPTYPSSITNLFTPPPSTAYADKKILTLHGADDPLVPLAQGRREIEIAQKYAAASSEGVVEIFAEEGVGHACTPGMVEKAAKWLWTWGLSVGGAKM